MKKKHPGWHELDTAAEVAELPELEAWKEILRDRFEAMVAGLDQLATAIQVLEDLGVCVITVALPDDERVDVLNCPVVEFCAPRTTAHQRIYLLRRALRRAYDERLTEIGEAKLGEAAVRGGGES